MPAKAGQLLTLKIADFKGGRNTLNAVNEIASNEHGAGQDVWTEFGALRKRRGFSVQAISIGGLTYDADQLHITSLSTVTAGATRLLMTLPNTTANHRTLGYTDNGTTFTYVGYTVGTVSTAGSSTTITGSGTAWNANIRAGDRFLASGGSTTQVVTVVSDTSITVADAQNLSAGTSYVIAPGLSLNNTVYMVSMNVSGAENVFITDTSSANRFRYDGTNLYRVTYFSASTVWMVKFKNYLWAFTATASNWSTINDPTTWPAANTQTVTDSYDPVIASVVYGNYMVIFTKYRMMRLLGDVFDPANPTYILEEIQVPPGYQFHYGRTAIIHEGLLVFLTKDGFYAYNGYKVSKLSQPIQPDVDGFREVDRAISQASDLGVAFSYKKRIWVSLMDATTTLARFVLDENGKWWKWITGTGTGSPTDFAYLRFSGANTYTLYGGSPGGANQGLLTLDSTNSDNTTSINGTWTSKEFVFPTDVTFVEAWVTMAKQSAGNLTFSFSIDRVTAINMTASMTGGVGTVIRKYIPIQRVGKSIRFTVANNTAGQTFEVYEIVCNIEPSEATRA